MPIWPDTSDAGLLPAVVLLRILTVFATSECSATQVKIIERAACQVYVARRLGGDVAQSEIRASSGSVSQVAEIRRLRELAADAVRDRRRKAGITS